MFMVLRRGSDHLLGEGRVKEGFLEDVNLVASQAENWGKNISGKRSNRSAPILQLRYCDLDSRFLLWHRAGPPGQVWVDLPTSAGAPGAL